MKESYYNFFHPLKNGNVIIFNAKNCALAEVNDKYISLFDKIRNKSIFFSEQEQEMLNELAEAGFVIDDPINKLANLKHLHYREKYNREFMSVTIAPTMDCNLACKYCFEERKPGVMTERIQESLLKFLDNNLHNKNLLEVNWYGGEPLLAIDTIEKMVERIVELTNRKGCSFRQNMISNGYLINKEVAKRLKRIGIETIQVTLDGTREIHDSRRVLKDGKTGSFDKILQGLKEALSVGLNVVLRINIDKTNYYKIHDLLLCLKQHEIKNLKIAYGHVLPYTSLCEGYGENCFTKEEYADRVLEIQNMMLQENFKNESVIYPTPKLTYCSACNVNSFLLDVDGDMYKCWCDVGNKHDSFSNIEEYDEMQNEEQNENFLKWVNKTPFDDLECKKCKLLPICMGGCPKMAEQEQKKKSCDLWKYNIKNMMTCTYNYYSND